MRLPTLSSLLCLAGLASLPVNAYEGDDPNIKSIPVGFLSDCLLPCRGTDYDVHSSEPTAFLRYERSCCHCCLYLYAGIKLFNGQFPA